MIKRFVLIALVLLVIWGIWVSKRPFPSSPNILHTENSMGSYHIHSFLSHDSRLSLETIAANAQQNKQDFVILTDHNKQLENPVVMNDVVLVPAMEQSTPDGHQINLYGALISAHPTDRKNPWKSKVYNLEIANVSSATRHSMGFLYFNALPFLINYFLKPDLTLAQTYDADKKAVELWDTLSNKALGFCAADAHGRINLKRNLQMWNLVLPSKVTGTAQVRSEKILDLLASGNFYCAAGLLVEKPFFEFYYANTTINIKGPNIPKQKIVVYSNGKKYSESSDNTVVLSNPPAGFYRVEVQMPLPNLTFGERYVPVIYSQRIIVP